ncbi:MAG: hypothetical protein Q8Q26_06280 [Pseudorhodobacter sp.]|nr:hypothetical protein [Pseudorhodobacter sp.]
MASRTWVDGYRRVRPLAPEEVAEIDTFVMLRRDLRMILDEADGGRKIVSRRSSLKPQACAMGAAAAS